MKNDQSRKIAEELQNLSPLVNNYFSNWLQHAIGYNKTSMLPLNESKEVLRSLFLECFYMAGGPIAYKIARGSYEEFCKEIKKIEDITQQRIHNIKEFTSSLTGIKPEQQNNSAKLLVRYLQKRFKGIGHKKASLYVKFLTVDLKFFGKFDLTKYGIVLPLDRYVFNLCKKLLKVDFSSEDPYNHRNIEIYNQKARDLAKDFLKGDYIAFESLWFIGHFYVCPGARNKPKSGYKWKEEWQCNRDELQINRESFFKKGNEIPKICPLNNFCPFFAQGRHKTKEVAS